MRWKGFVFPCNSRSSSGAGRKRVVRSHDDKEKNQPIWQSAPKPHKRADGSKAERERVDVDSGKHMINWRCCFKRGKSMFARPSQERFLFK